MSVTKMRRVSRAQLVFLRLQVADPKATFAGLIHLVSVRGYKFGFAVFKFQEIFGYRPNFKEKVEPSAPSSDLLTWLEAQRRNYGNRMRRIDEKLAKANELPLRRLEAIVGEIEALTASLRAAGIDTTHSADAEAYGIIDRIERSMVEHGAKLPAPEFQEAAE